MNKLFQWLIGLVRRVFGGGTGPEPAVKQHLGQMQRLVIEMDDLAGEIEIIDKNLDAATTANKPKHRLDSFRFQLKHAMVRYRAADKQWQNLARVVQIERGVEVFTSIPKPRWTAEQLTDMARKHAIDQAELDGIAEKADLLVEQALEGTAAPYPATEEPAPTPEAARASAHEAEPTPEAKPEQPQAQPAQTDGAPPQPEGEAES